MNQILKASAITLLAALTLAPLAPVASAGDHHDKKVVIYYQSPSGSSWYEVSTVRTSTPVYTYTVPVSNAPIYAYQAPAPPPPAMGDVKIVAAGPDNTIWIDGQFAGTSSPIMRVALEEGSHDMQLKDAQGNTLFSGSVDVVAGQTTQIQPQRRASSNSTALCGWAA